MSNNPNKQKKQKKQALLGQVQGKHQARIKRAPQPSQVPLEQVAAQTATAIEQQPGSKKPLGKWITLAIITMLILIFPKPKLITYEKLGLVSQSVYWDGLPGIDPILFDSHLHPRPALERNTLYLCADQTNPDSCQRYQILEQAGFISALKKLILD
ncbi:hypothetical protein PA25_09160 [Pseudoalteromonas sp. A25]|uniref:hypothetical protein n=1 Tax=Pseudoalteromonas sp. A25 TaxID=116092 RepID=UPI001260E55C|nr:hypothetical protein [Pseudoalteromonas sp. A25]BBN80931.1 hypothetical protein PA25_09160 [Pseudoalteromonas sp. A25]